jgi:hypothetical protein
MADPGNGGPREWRTPGMADLGNGGPREWRTQTGGGLGVYQLRSARPGIAIGNLRGLLYKPIDIMHYFAAGDVG